LCLPRAVHSSWVERLATTGTGYAGIRELFPGGEDAHRAYPNAEAVFKASEQKRRFFKLLTAGRGRMGLFRRFSTVEGDPISEWLLVEDGKLTYVHDSSRDAGAKPWAVYVWSPVEFAVGFMREHNFVEGEPASTDSPVLVYQLRVPNVLDRRQIDSRYFY
jgi:hypothetical protein